MKSEKGCGIGPEFPKSHLIQLFFIIGFIFSWFLDEFFFRWSIRFGFLPLDIIRVSGFLLIMIFAYIFIKYSSIVVKSEIYEKEILVTEGIFSYSRNPMYLGILLIYFAFVVLIMSIFTFIAWIIISIIMDQMVRYEEKELFKIFGEEYKDYQEKVPKWILIKR